MRQYLDPERNYHNHNLEISTVPKKVKFWQPASSQALSKIRRPRCVVFRESFQSETKTDSEMQAQDNYLTKIPEVALSVDS